MNKILAYESYISMKQQPNGTFFKEQNKRGKKITFYNLLNRTVFLIIDFNDIISSYSKIRIERLPFNWHDDTYN